MSGVVMPAGAILTTAQTDTSTPPAGWLFCDGSSQLRASFPTLFTAIGTTYGSADGTHFNLPDLRGRLVVTKDDSGGSDAGRLGSANTLGTAGGAENVTLTSAQSGVPAHGHGVTDPGHAHVNGGDLHAGFHVDNGSFFGLMTGVNTTTNTTGLTVNNNSAADASTSHTNMPPFITLNSIIKT